MSRNEKNHKQTSLKDPFWKREAKKYENPIPSREFIMEYLAKVAGPVSCARLSEALKLVAKDRQEALLRRLKAMIQDGQIIKNRHGDYALVSKISLVCGRVVGYKEGHGFLIPDDESARIFLSAKQMRLVFPEDRVLVSVNFSDANGRKEGIIVEVLEHGISEVVGRYVAKKGVGFVSPLDSNIVKEIIIPKGKGMGAKSGELVVASIVSFPSREDSNTNAIGEVNEILGDHMSAGMETEVAIRAHGLPNKWNDALLQEVKNVEYRITKKTREGRKELQNLSFVTIDGEDAKDFDDAVFCKSRTKGGWTLYVAIADVSHYVQPNSALDAESFLRGNSVYFPDKVVPMLPEELSNDLCSLKPDVERLCMICEMSIKKDGDIANFDFYEGIIKSHARLTYDEVFAVLESGQSKNKKLQTLLPQLQALRSVYKSLLKQRQLRGALEFDTVETKIIFDKNRKIKKIVPFVRNYAHSMIEEFMLAANVSASKFLQKGGIPVLYRVHPIPEKEKLDNLRQFLGALKLKLQGKYNPKTSDYLQLIMDIRKRQDRETIKTLILRSLSQATYSAKNVGHFGLAYKAYVHFTSPIRRYPDLLIHRAIRHILQKKNPEDFLYSQIEVNKFGEHCSMTERRADDATRDVVLALKCFYMLEKVGETFSGVISGVTNFGVFVLLDDLYVEGLLHITSLPRDYYEFDMVKHALRGRARGKSYKLGDKIKVLLARVNADERQIDFAIA